MSRESFCAAPVEDLPELKDLITHFRSHAGDNYLDSKKTPEALGIVVTKKTEDSKALGQMAIDEGRPFYILFEDSFDEFIARRIASFLRRKNMGKVVQSQFAGPDVWFATAGREFICLTPVDLWFEQRKTSLGLNDSINSS